MREPETGFGATQGAGADLMAYLLPSALDLAGSRDLALELRAHAAQDPGLTIDASQVERLHTPGAQVLLSALLTHPGIRVANPSEAFVTAADDLGLWTMIAERVTQ